MGLYDARKTLEIAHFPTYRDQSRWVFQRLKILVECSIHSLPTKRPKAVSVNWWKSS